LAPKTRIASAFGALAQRVHQFQFEVQRGLDAPGPAHRFGEPPRRPAGPVDDAETARDARFAGVGRVRLVVEFAVEHQRQLQQALVAAAEERQGAMRGNRQERFRVG
jgi:hypothetical protein